MIKTLKRLAGSKLVRLLAVLGLLVLLWWYWPETPPPIDYSGPVADWPAYGGNQGGERFSPLTQITPANVRFLEVVWEHHSGDISTPQ